MPDPETVQATHALLCRTVHRFLEASLKNDAHAEAQLQAQAHAATEAEGAPLVLQSRETAPLPPTADQIARIAAAGNGGAERLAALETRFGPEISVSALIPAADALCQRRQPQQAIALLQLALERAPESAEAWRGLGDAYREMDDEKQAADSYRRAWKRLAEDDTRGRLQLEAVLREMGASPVAEEVG